MTEEKFKQANNLRNKINAAKDGLERAEILENWLEVPEEIFKRHKEEVKKYFEQQIKVLKMEFEQL